MEIRTDNGTKSENIFFNPIFIIKICFPKKIYFFKQNQIFTINIFILHIFFTQTSISIKHKKKIFHKIQKK